MGKQSKLVFMILAVTVVLLSAMAALAQQQQRRYTIALIPGLTTDGFYITMRKGAEEAARRLNAELIFQGGPDFSPTTQIPVLNAIIARRPDAILIAPTDVQQLIAPLKRAHDAGIKVITVDTFIGNNQGRYQTGSGNADFPLAYVASDNVEGGRVGARALAQAIPNQRGKVYVSNVRPGISTTDQREQGFKEGMRAFPNIQVLETQYNENDANRAATQLAAVLARNADLAGVFGANLFSAQGAANGVKTAGRSGRIQVVAFDCPESIINDVKGGTIDIAICQKPAEIGQRGVELAVQALNGQRIPTNVGTGFVVINRQNVDSPEAQAAVYSSR